jgi:HAD superfamily hydrolase (TIGR01509 family)
MDGVIMDNNAFHETAWRRFCHHYGIHLSDQELHEFVFGRVAKDTLEFIFKIELTPPEIDHYVYEKEVIYRTLYQSRIKPLEGLIPFLDDLESNQVPMAMATSAPPGNVTFAFLYLPIERYFQSLLNASHIKKGKPDPEIYIRSIQHLGLPPENCIVFEDSLSGIKAALGAGARVIGVSTTHQASEMNGVARVISDFRDLTYQDLLSILN